jgi:P-type Cu2+ transporter
MDAGRSAKEHSTAVLDVHPMRRASEKAVIETVLGRRPGVLAVEANPVAQTATVTYDPRVTSLAELRDWVTDCGYHCAGQSVPTHICDPLMEPEPADGHGGHGEAVTAVATPPAPTAAPPAEHAGHAMAPEEALRSPEETMGHGGHGAMSMAAMVADMRNRFLVAAIFSVPILLWSPIGRDVLGFHAAAPFGLRDDVWMLLLSLPVIF